MNIYYIYQHRRVDTNEVFYVGKGKGNRCYQKHNRNRHWNNITEKTDYAVEILFDNLSEDIAHLVEIGLITKYKTQGIHLCNYTIGGDGASGHKHSPKSKQLMSERKLGHKMSEQTKKILSEKFKGRKISEEQKRQISQTLKGRKLSEEHKKAISLGIKKKQESVKS